MEVKEESTKPDVSLTYDYYVPQFMPQNFMPQRVTCDDSRKRT